MVNIVYQHTRGGLALQVILKKNGRTLIAQLIGELDHHSAVEVRETLENAIKSKAIQNLIFDFSKLNFMDSSGIGVIIGRYKLIKALGGTVNVVCANRQMDRLMTMSGLKKLIDVYSDLDQAISNL